MLGWAFMSEQNKNIVASDVLRMSAEGDYIYLDFGHTNAEDDTAQENVNFTNHVVIRYNNLIGIISNLVNFGIKYQEEFKKDIGLPKT